MPRQQTRREAIAFLFGNCVLCLNAKTGERVWHYKTVHHDLFDYDLPWAPNLVTVQHEGKPVDAVAQVTKRVVLLERETGAVNHNILALAANATSTSPARPAFDARRR